MKKLLSILVALCLALSMATAAYADAPTAPAGEGGSTTVGTPSIVGVDIPKNFELDEKYELIVPVQAYAHDTETTVIDETYSVELIWGDMLFLWGDHSDLTNTWNPETHEYDKQEDGSTADDTTETWILADETTPLKNTVGDVLEFDSIYTNDEGTEITQTRQNFVAVFNHSNKYVHAKAVVEDVSDAGNIEATASHGFIGQNLSAEDGIELKYGKDDTPYDMDNGAETSASLYVWLSNPPDDFTAQDEVTVANLKVTFSRTGLEDATAAMINDPEADD